jgi:putative peptidoglycan lipid II flippase
VTLPPVSGPALPPGANSAIRAAGTGFLASAALIAAITILARVAGFGRYAVFAASVHAQCVGNAYASANVLPNILFEVVAGGALAGAVVPLLAGAISQHARDQVDAIASALLGWALLVLVPLSLLLALLAGPISRLVLTDSCRGGQEFAASAIVIFAPQITLYGVGVVLSGTLQAHRRFFWPAFAPLISSAVMITGYLMFAATAAGAQDDPARLPGAAQAWLVWGTTAAVAAMTLPLLIPVRRAGIRLRPRLAFPPGIARQGRALAFAGIGALLAQQLSVLVGLYLANHTGDRASYAIFTYAQAVYLLPYAVLAVPLATSAFPRLAERAARQDRDGFAHAASVSTRAVIVAGLLGAALLAGTAPAAGAFFAALDERPMTVLAPALLLMAPGVLGFGLVAHIGRALYALHRGRTAGVSIAAGWLVVTIASVIAVPLLGPVPGLAAGTSVGMVVAGALLLSALHRCAGPGAVAGIGRVLIAGAAAAGVAGGGGWLLSSALTTDGASLASAVVAGLAGAAVSLIAFAGLLAAADRRDLDLLLARVVRRGPVTQ